MSYLTPKLVMPTLIHGDNFKPDIHGKRKFDFTLYRAGENECDLVLGNIKYPGHHLIEFLNACAVCGFDTDFSEKGFECLEIGSMWSMRLTRSEYKNVKRLLNLITGKEKGEQSPFKGFA